MTKPYFPELVQMAFGAPTGEYECPAIVDSFTMSLINMIWYVVWNRDQHDWDKYSDPKIPGMAFRSYYWGDDEAESAKPNLSFGEAEIRWYKHPGRGMSVNVDWPPERWCAWYVEALKAIEDYSEQIAKEKGWR